MVPLEKDPPVLRSAHLEGPRVRLAGQTAADADDCFPLVYEVDAILDMLVWDGPEDLPSMRAFFADWRVGGGEVGHDYFFVVRLADGRVCGHCGLRFSGWTRGSGAPRLGNIGYWMGTAYWGQGLMTEAVELLVWLALEVLAADGVEASCMERNAGSARVLEKAGLVRDHAFVPGSPSAHGHDACERRYELLRADYAPRAGVPVAHALELED